MRKLTGLLAVIAMPAVIVLFTVPETTKSSADAGFLRRIFSGCGGGGGGGGLQSYSGCGGGGLQSYNGCGGGGLQYGYSGYASCGGGGGGLQYAPTAYYAPAYQPAYYAPASNCPGGVCPPGAGGLTYSYAPAYQVAASPPVPLNPGETYVAGSLRRITPESRSALASNALPAKTRLESRPIARNAAQGKARALPEGVTAYQLTQDGCHTCESDRQQSRQQGVPLEVLSFSDTEDAFKIANLVRQLDVEIDGTPFYLLVEDGVVISYHSGEVNNFTSLVAEAENMKGKTGKTALVKTNPVPEPPEESKLDRIETAMLQMAEDMRALRTTLEGQRTALK